MYSTIRKLMEGFSLCLQEGRGEESEVLQVKLQKWGWEIRYIQGTAQQVLGTVHSCSNFTDLSGT